MFRVTIPPLLLRIFDYNLNLWHDLFLAIYDNGLVFSIWINLKINISFLKMISHICQVYLWGYLSLLGGSIVCMVNKGNNKITELRTILQRESQNSYLYKQTKSVNNRKTMCTILISLYVFLFHYVIIIYNCDYWLSMYLVSRYKYKEAYQIKDSRVSTTITRNTHHKNHKNVIKIKVRP